MPYVSGFDRNQLMCCSWDAFVDEESIARIIDAFVEHLDIKKYGVKAAAVEGRPSYDPKSLYKLYIYGSRKGIRSSRKLAESCRVNLEVKWMTSGVEPDFRTIADFRKDNIDSLKEIFHEFNRRISGAVEWGFSSVDGTKIQANNAGPGAAAAATSLVIPNIPVPIHELTIKAINSPLPIPFFCSSINIPPMQFMNACVE